MSQSILNDVNEALHKKRVPLLKPGYKVRVYQKIKEGEKERTQIFEGLVIRISAGTGVNRTFTVRKLVEGIGVEKIFPLYAPFVEKIEVVGAGKVRRAKLYYMRDLTGKSTRLRDKAFGDVLWVGEEAMAEAEEEVVVEEAPQEEAEVAEEAADEEVAAEEVVVAEPEAVEEDAEKA